MSRTVSEGGGARRDLSEIIEKRATAASGQRIITIVTREEPEPFGFGSGAPARLVEKFPDTPGPGKYEPRSEFSKASSLRGVGIGFTSKAKRRLEFARGNKNPAPNMYLPALGEKKVLPTIGGIPMGKRVSCYPDERETSSTPGPASYTLAEERRRSPSAAFRSRTDRSLWKTEKRKRPKFDGRNFVISPSQIY